MKRMKHTQYRLEYSEQGGFHFAFPDTKKGQNGFACICESLSEYLCMRFAHSITWKYNDQTQTIETIHREFKTFCELNQID